MVSKNKSEEKSNAEKIVLRERRGYVPHVVHKKKKEKMRN